jgi:hypothetical protein
MRHYNRKRGGRSSKYQRSMRQEEVREKETGQKEVRQEKGRTQGSPLHLTKPVGMNLVFARLLT